jgi:hypothetical protein
MDQLQTPQAIQHIVQLYQPPVSTNKIQNPQIIHISHPSLSTSEGKVTYQQTITSKSLHIPVSHVPDLMSQSQMVMSCEQSHLQSVHQLQTQMSPQVLQSSDMGQQLHVILPQVPVYKQHMLVGEVQPQYYGQYDTFEKVVTKVELNAQVEKEKQIE